ncbi:DUF3551 domain-containing protein [Rhodopseudomonas boonkerdii]|uniref:DUF3551 domain-containing protein n=1 Tax=Rhodopseudomonas boonkerdii TaxID=475937 RepID=UPI001E503720|nr:DUF3551 domain-containing protein [Rhodopseudomonas boonkerdii]UGV26082.1 DUF3551 domain-containing protein [Rhodopseudomonas boonkerdii]
MNTRRVSLLAVAMLAVCLADGAAEARPARSVGSAIPPFCVLTGGPRGPGSLPQICRFFDYRQCLQAAAELRGNCVVNVDYPGKITSAPGAAWSQPER